MSDTVQIVAIPPSIDHLARWHDQVAPLLERALKRDEHEQRLGEVYERHLEGLVQLMVILGEEDVLAALALERGAENLHIWLCAGEELERWIAPTLRAINHLAAEQGAKHITLHGRPGWMRLLAPYGYKPTFIDMMRDITPKEGLLT